MEENRPLLVEGSASALGRIVAQGVNIAHVLNEEAAEAGKRRIAAAKALTEAIQNPATPAQRIHELEREHKRTREVHERRDRAFNEFADFIDRASLARRQRLDKGEE
jgi:hypothetical protein